MQSEYPTGFLIVLGNYHGSRTKWTQNNLYDTFVPLPEFALHIPQSRPRTSAKIYAVNQRNWQKRIRWSQIKQKGLSQIFWNGQQRIKWKNANNEPNLSTFSGEQIPNGVTWQKVPLTKGYGTAYKVQIELEL